MANILELCQRLMQRHCQIADAAADLAALVAEQGQEINLLSTLVDPQPEEPFVPTLDQVGGFGFDRGPDPIIPREMAVHAPSEIPPYLAPYLEKSPAHTAEFAPDHEPAVDDDGPLSCGTTHHAPTPSNIPEGAVMVTSSDLDKPLSHIGGRKKTEMTAREWALSAHFLAYMKTPPFNGWPADKQTTARDAFVAAVAPGDRMNRWGRRFSKFCGVP